jgi:hypothetical protein
MTSGPAFADGPSRPLSFEFDTAILLDRSLFDGDHLPLHLSEFSGCLLIPTNQKTPPAKIRS